ncbi:MAG: PBP1A family penicillin-binding protein [Armatimonadota bacterium]
MSRLTKVMRVFTVVVVLLTFIVLGSGYFVIRAARGLQANSAADLKNETPSGVTTIYAADINPNTGKHLELGTVSNRYQINVKLSEIPQNLKQATIDIEDERFYEHNGVDFRSLARAVYRNVLRWKLSEGASTLTQQLAINRLLTRKKTIDRKLQGMVLAVQIEKTLSKDTILERYLNEVNYGGNIYGVAAAAKYYFDKPLRDLTISECAYIAGLPQRPAFTNPFRNPAAAINRRNVVLAKMRDLGHITPDGYQAAVMEVPAIMLDAPKIRTQFRAPHFTNWVLRKLVKEHGSDRIYRGGLKVYTTLSLELQRRAVEALKEGLQDGSDSGVTEGAVVSIDPTNGYVRAMVGSSDYSRTNFNYATGRSQCGSTFKPFVYAAAFGDNKLALTPDSSRFDGPTTYGDWTPKNYGGRYSYGRISIRSAVASSKNTIAVKIASEVGIKNVIGTAKRAGLDVPMNRDLTLALGTAAVSPLELTTAYCTFANAGNAVKPVAIVGIIDGDGDSVPVDGIETTRNAISAAAVRSVDECLKAVIDYGSAAGARGIHQVYGARGKTGTTSDNRDAWFVGYTPSLVTTVYMCGVRRFSENGKEVVRYLPMEGVTGGRVCAPVWAAIMREAPKIMAELERIAQMPLTDPSTDEGKSTTKTPVEAKAEPVTTDAKVDTAPEDAGLDSVAPMEQPDIETAPPVVPEPAEEPGRMDIPQPTIPAPTSVRKKPEPKPDPEVEVLICSDSNLRANEYCVEVVRQMMPKSRAPKRTCNLHGAQPDERPN